MWVSKNRDSYGRGLYMTEANIVVKSKIISWIEVEILRIANQIELRIMRFDKNDDDDYKNMITQSNWDIASIARDVDSNPTNHKNI